MLSRTVGTSSPRRYSVCARAVAGDKHETHDKSFSLTVYGQSFPATHTDLNLGAYPWGKAGKIDLNAGLAIIIINDVGHGYDSVDCIAMCTDPYFDPNPIPLLANDQTKTALMLSGDAPTLKTKLETKGRRRP